MRFVSNYNVLWRCRQHAAELDDGQECWLLGPRPAVIHTNHTRGTAPAIRLWPLKSSPRLPQAWARRSSMDVRRGDGEGYEVGIGRRSRP
jgi:hypothetical protein